MNVIFDEPLFSKDIINIIRGYGYWKQKQFKRKHGKHPAISLDIFVAPGDNDLIKFIPKCNIDTTKKYKWDMT